MLCHFPMGIDVDFTRPPDKAGILICTGILLAGTGIWGFAPGGGRIDQKIVRDASPLTAYDGNRAIRLHLKLGLPWFTLYDEKFPCTDNTDGGKPLSAELAGHCGVEIEVL